MRFGVVGVGFTNDAESAAALAEAAESVGVDSVWAVEHVVVPADYRSKYPYSASGRMPGPEGAPIPDPLIWLTWIAASSTTLKVATGVLILPQRNPVLLAKEVATLDAMSGGRAILGVGIGWLREEFEAIGAPFDERATVIEEHVAALRTLWADDEPTFHGRWSNFDRALMKPKPANGSSVPIHIGGHSHAAARRAGRLGDGFYPTTSEEELPALLAGMRTAALEAGRDPDAIEVTVPFARDAEQVKRLAELGVDRVLFAALGATAADVVRHVEQFAETVMVHTPSVGG